MFHICEVKKRPLFFVKNEKTAEDHMKECHRINLPNAVILISEVQISASMKINWMPLTSTLDLMVLTTALIMEEGKFHGFQQSEETFTYKTYGLVFLNKQDTM